MKKWLMICFSLCLCLGISGCSKEESKAETVKYDGQAVLEKAQQTVQLINEDKFDEVLNNAIDKVKSSITASQLKEGFASLGDTGAFVEFGEHEMAIQSDYAVMILMADYENMKVQFTLSYDKELALAGIYMKPIS